MQPAKLYRYRSLEREQQERKVFDGQLYFPSRTQFNDPFDCIAPSFDGIPPKQWKKFIEHRMMEEFTELSEKERREKARELKQMSCDELQRRAQEVADYLGILCLSAKRDNILMWSHYANNHQGFCLEFDATKKPFASAYRVQYQRKRWTYDISAHHKERNAKNLVHIKYEDWCYEAEWRIICEKGKEIYPFPLEALTGVIFGCRMSKVNKVKVKRWISERRCRPALYQATLSKRHFRLDIERC